MAEHLDVAPVLVQAALNYVADYAAEIEAAIEDNVSYDQHRLARLLPQLEVFEASAASGASTS